MSFQDQYGQEIVIDSVQAGLVQFMAANPHFDGIAEDRLKEQFQGMGARKVNFYDAMVSLRHSNIVNIEYPEGTPIPNYKLTLIGERMADVLDKRDTVQTERDAALWIMRGIHNGKADFMEPEVTGIGPTRVMGILSSLTFTSYLKPAPDNAKVPFELTQRGRSVLDHFAPRAE